LFHFEFNPSAPTLLVIAHPGHELRVWGWVTSVRPLVSVLTDGSGSTGHPRLDVTRASLERIGARPESPFGPLTDRMVYTSLLTGEHEPLLQLAARLAHAIVVNGVQQVASDAIEGYNPTHDVCALLARAAVEVAAARGRSAMSLEFALAEGPPSEASPEGLRYELSDEDLDAKVELARSYAREAGPMLEQEVEALLVRHGRQAFRTETLARTSDMPLKRRFSDAPPYYETHGERRVGEGKYAAVVRLQDHLLPFERRLSDWVRTAS